MITVYHDKITNDNGETLNLFKLRSMEGESFVFEFGDSPSLYQAMAYRIIRGDNKVKSDNYKAINYLESKYMNSMIDSEVSYKDKQANENNENYVPHYLRTFGNAIIQRKKTEDMVDQVYLDYLVALVYDLSVFSPIYSYCISFLCDRAYFTDEMIEWLKDYVFVESFTLDELDMIRGKLAEELSVAESTDPTSSELSAQSKENESV